MPVTPLAVDLDPIVPWVTHPLPHAVRAGHVLISSKRVEPRFVNLSDEEAADLW